MYSRLSFILLYSPKLHESLLILAKPRKLNRNVIQYYGNKKPKNQNKTFNGIECKRLSTEFYAEFSKNISRKYE